jgi:hypothetical protein
MVMVLRSTTCFNGVEDPLKAKEHLYRKLDELVNIAIQHDAKGIKIKLKEIVPEYTPQESDGVL